MADCRRRRAVAYECTLWIFWETRRQGEDFQANRIVESITGFGSISLQSHSATVIENCRGSIARELQANPASLQIQPGGIQSGLRAERANSLASAGLQTRRYRSPRREFR